MRYGQKSYAPLQANTNNSFNPAELYHLPVRETAENWTNFWILSILNAPDQTITVCHKKQPISSQPCIYGSVTQVRMSSRTSDAWLIYSDHCNITLK